MLSALDCCSVTVLFQGYLSGDNGLAPGLAILAVSPRVAQAWRHRPSLTILTNPVPSAVADVTTQNLSRACMTDVTLPLSHALALELRHC